MKGPAEIIAGILFAIMALIHLVRLLCPFDVVIDSYSLPIWVSSLFFIGSGVLSAWLFRTRSI